MSAMPLVTAATRSQYVTFFCGGVEYGVEILQVQEIRGWDGVTRVPHAPAHVLGVMNLRGTVVPVIDLRARFGLESKTFDGSTVVIVVRVEGTAGAKIAGLVVDAVSEVCDVAADALRPALDLGGGAAASCVTGFATIGDKMVMLLDMPRLVAASVASDGALPAVA